MANKKITDLIEKVNVIDDDWIEIVDTEDLTESPEGSSKKAKKTNILSTPTLDEVCTQGNFTNSNIGIGTILPSSELDVYGTISLNGFDGLRYDTTSGSLYAGHLAGNNQIRSNGFGYNALKSNTGLFSSGFGFNALSNNTGTASNGFGYFALSSNTGSYSSGFGTEALTYNTGNFSSAFGHYALRYNQGNNNTAIGSEAGFEATPLTGASNTFLGYNASYGAATTITNSTAVGANVTLTESNTVILGNGANVGIDTTSPTEKLEVNGNVKATGFLVLKNALNFSANIKAENLTANRNIQAPDKDGTLATLSDIPSGGGGDSYIQMYFNCRYTLPSNGNFSGFNEARSYTNGDASTDSTESVPVNYVENSKAIIVGYTDFAYKLEKIRVASNIMQNAEEIQFVVGYRDIRAGVFYNADSLNPVVLHTENIAKDSASLNCFTALVSFETPLDIPANKEVIIGYKCTVFSGTASVVNLWHCATTLTLKKA